MEMIMRLVKGMFVLGLLLSVVGCAKSTAYWSEQMKSSDARTRLHAVGALRERVTDASAAAVLTRALTDEEMFVRRDAARALGRFGTHGMDAVPALRGLLNDPEPGVRRAAEQSLKQLDPTGNALTSRDR